MFAIIITFHIIVCFVLILVILLQAGRGAGLSNIFGGGGVQTLFGTSAATFLTRATAVCAILFLLTCLSLGVISVRRGRSLMEREAVWEEWEEEPLGPEGESVMPAPLESKPITGPAELPRDEVPAELPVQ